MDDAWIKGHAGKPYRPSNGTEGDSFDMVYCDRCARDRAWRRAQAQPDKPTRAEGCPILANALAFGIDEPGFPKEWVYDERGQPTCTAFRKIMVMPRRARTGRGQLTLPLPVVRPVLDESSATYDAVLRLRAAGYRVWRAGKDHRVIGDGKAIMLDTDGLKQMAATRGVRHGD